MSAAVENGVDASKPRGVFSRAFAKRAQPFEEGEFCGENKWHRDYRGAHGAFLVIGRCYLIKHNNLVVDAVMKLRRILLINGFSSKKKKSESLARNRDAQIYRKIAFFLMERKKECSCCFVDLCFLIFLIPFFFISFFYFYICSYYCIFFFIYTLDYYLFLSGDNLIELYRMDHRD